MTGQKYIFGQGLAPRPCSRCGIEHTARSSKPHPTWGWDLCRDCKSVLGSMARHPSRGTA